MLLQKFSFHILRAGGNIYAPPSQVSKQSRDIFIKINYMPKLKTIIQIFILTYTHSKA